jgi:hypothetical protein
MPGVKRDPLVSTDCREMAWLPTDLASDRWLLSQMHWDIFVSKSTLLLRQYWCQWQGKPRDRSCYRENRIYCLEKGLNSKEIKHNDTLSVLPLTVNDPVHLYIN